MSLKADFLFRDRLIRGISEDKTFKITVVKTTDVVKDAQRRHELSLTSAVMLGRALTGALLMASSLKGEERFTIRFEGDGPLQFVFAEANAVGAVRGYVGKPHTELDYTKPGTQLSDALGKGTLSSSKTLYNEARPVTGTVELEKGDIVTDLAHYLVQSEQIPSALILDIGVDEKGQLTHSGGILVQALPDAPEHDLEKIEVTLAQLPLLSDLFGRGDYIDSIMHQAMIPFKARELSRMLVDFFCPCTEEGFVRALSMLDVAELAQMQDQEQHLVCHYCNKNYVIPAEKVNAIYISQKVRMN
jgi:molecular chaperone Hsp33